MEKRKPYLTPNEAASLLMVSPITIRQWAAKGLLKAELTLGGHRRFFRYEIERFARDNGLTLQRSAVENESRLLVVDDDPQVANLIREVLSQHEGLTIESASDGFDAGVKVQQFLPDVMLIDLMMPGLDGFEVCRRLKADPVTRSIRLIAMTGYPSSENTERALAVGAECCLSKPFDTQLLFEIFSRPEQA